MDAWPEGSTLSERLAWAFGLGLAVDTLAMLVKTSGASLGGISLRGVDVTFVYSLIAFGAGMLLASLAWRRKIGFAVKPQRADLAMLFVVAAVAVMESLYFLKYPIFPQYRSVDFGAHVQLAQSLITGTQTSIPAGILYFGVHFQLAAALLLVGGEPLVTIQRAMAFLVALSPLSFYLAGKQIFSRRLAGIVIAALYSFSGTIWFVGVFNSGLFPNFFGVLSALFLVAATVKVASSVRSAEPWLVFLLALLMAYFSHYTTITVLPALILLPLLQFFRDREKAVGYLVPAIAAVAPGLVGLAIFPQVLTRALELAVAGGGSPTGSTFLSGLISGVPVLSFMALEVYDDVALVFFLLFTAVALYRGISGKKVLLSIPVIWVVSLLATAPLNVSAWRFSYEALIPFTLLAGYGIFALLPKPRSASRRRSGSYVATLLVLVILLTPMLVTSWSQVSMADAVSGASTSADAQQGVYSTMYWLKTNTPNGSIYLSATDWRFSYSELMIGRQAVLPESGGCLTSPHEAIRAAVQNNASYVVVTNLVTCSLPPDPQLFLWNTMKASSNLTLVYSNSDVRVFEVAS